MEIKLVNRAKTREIIFDNLAYVLHQKDLGKADVALASFKGTQKVGIKITNRSLGTREVNIVGYVLADNYQDMLNRKKELQRVCDPFSDFLIMIDDTYQLEVSPNNTIEWGVEYYLNNEYLCMFMIDGICANPCFQLVNPPVHVDFSSTIGMFHFAVKANAANPVIMGLRSSAQIKTVDYEGEVACGFRFIVEFSGTCRNFYIQNMLTDEKLQIDYTFHEGDRLEINTEFGEKTITLNGETSLLNKLNFDYMDFFQLDFGINYIYFGVDGELENIANIYIEYNPLFLEV